MRRRPLTLSGSILAVIGLLLMGCTIEAAGQCARSWYVEKPPGEWRPGRLFFVDSLHGWTSTYFSYASAMRTTDGGRTWQPIRAGRGNFAPLFFLDANRGWVKENSSSDRRILATTDGGIHWVVLDTLSIQEYNEGIGIKQMWFTDSLHGFTAGKLDTSGVYTRLGRTTDGGRSWMSVVVKGSQDVGLAFVDCLTGWAAGDGIYATTDGGRSWFEQLHPDGWWIAGVDFIDRQRGWACTYDHAGRVLHTSNGGAYWEVQALIAPETQFIMEAVSFIDSANGWIFGFRFYQGDIMECIYGTTDGGISWYEESLGLARHLDAGTAVDACHAWAVSFDGSILALGSPTAVRTEREGRLPQKTVLLANYPNPFNPSTTITFELPEAGHMRLEVYDELGRKVKTLLDEDRRAGPHEVLFDATGLSSGAYFCQLYTSGIHISRRMLLVK